MIRAALTGGIGTGKSYVLARFAGLRVPTIDADRIVHRLLDAGSPAVAAIAARFGDAVVTAAGAVDRRRLGTLVFADASARADLEAILHPLVYAAIAEWFDALDRAGVETLGVADIPLLFETGHEKDFDTVIVAACPPDVQVRRVMARDGLAEPDARRRLEAQWPIDEKTRRADFVILTDGSHEETDRQVDRVWRVLAMSHAP
jgi:dephospho-CoA kinase